MSNRGFKGFTLAEVLITLGVIGVVAAMTMPALIANHQKKQTATRLKKAYSMMSQAIQAAQIQHGPISSWVLFDQGKSVSAQEKIELEADFINQYLKPNLKIIKVCAPTSDECWKVPKAINGSGSYYLNGQGQGTISSSFILANGDSVYMWLGGLNDMYDAHVRFLYDINGKDKGPSMFGKDVFAMNLRLQDNILKMHGTGVPMDKLLNDSSYEEGCSKEASGGSAGIRCGAVIQYYNWEITKDYPW